MIKPDSLRARLTEAFPDEFGHDAARLALWIEEGNVRCNAAPDNLNFSVSYKLSVSVQGWRLQSALLWIVVIDWLLVRHPCPVTTSELVEALWPDPDSEPGLPEARIGCLMASIRRKIGWGRISFENAGYRLCQHDQ